MSYLPALDPVTTGARPTPAVPAIIEARMREVGGIAVRRVLPYRGGRGVGPFVFLDHMGPTTFDAGEGIDVLPHPHIGLSTVTYLFEGEIVHRDSVGSLSPIRPGDVNWMIAGRGIAHSERTVPAIRRAGSRLHGLQIWVALPRDSEEMEPSFRHHDAASLPVVEQPGARIRVLAGRAFGVVSPVETLSPVFYADVELTPGHPLPMPEDHEERAAYVVDGAVGCAEARATSGHMLLFAPGQAASLLASEPTRLALVGGALLDGKRHIWWNFVSSSSDRLQQAKRDWKAGRFPKVVGDEIEFTPLPE
jgi:redox-sensitive bicupin YhaK (pirin superfamily)